MRFFLKLKYDGTSFHGWQKLKNYPTVQATLEDGLARILQRKVLIHGCGRTDSGVHAQIYYAHVDLDEEEPKNLIYRLNGILPADIQILDLIRTPEHAHAQRDARERCYEYRIHRQKNPFIFKYSYWYPHQVDLTLLESATQLIVQTTDFSAFTKTPDRQKTTQCKVLQAQWSEQENRDLRFEICADHFVRGMIRILVAQLLEVASGRGSIQHFYDGLLLGKKQIYFNMAPPHGLHLIRIKYRFPDYLLIILVAFLA